MFVQIHRTAEQKGNVIFPPYYKFFRVFLQPLITLLKTGRISLIEKMESLNSILPAVTSPRTGNAGK